MIYSVSQALSGKCSDKDVDAILSAKSVSEVTADDEGHEYVMLRNVVTMVFVDLLSVITILRSVTSVTLMICN